MNDLASCYPYLVVPAVEQPPIRVFCFLRKGQLDPIEVVAESICDETGYGTSFKLKARGTTVGHIQGDLAAWWVEDRGSDPSDLMCFEFNSEARIKVQADTKELASEEEDPRSDRRLVLKREGQPAGEVFAPPISWWVERLYPTNGD